MVRRTHTPCAGGHDIPLSFPNGSRSYDPTRRRVRFWGYDSALEITFFVEVDALMPVDPQSEADPESAHAEAIALQAFDEGVARIREVAAAVHARRPAYSHHLTLSDF
ncbi:hypothetical protein GCM10017083_07510 [Thalassobaculum fulvum]|uniref:DUF1488 domain-containing protein n=1 Tax=Thalassobaculum fulvum TaxID=1633335 RepID=A0A919CN09_9PROT|nr:DUF1488 domain-containing protein [Thalassobaculum fulvum]GHD42456.1 hypothetical protein GCM10017083_07510 [Thalassobaculum fulvum]